MNESGIHPCGHRVLVLPDTTETKTASGIIITDRMADQDKKAQVRAVVVELGQGAFADTAGGQWVNEGDHVIIGKYAGALFKGQDEKEYRIIDDLDVVAKLD